MHTARSNLFSATWSRMVASAGLGLYVLYRLTVASRGAFPHEALVVLFPVAAALTLGAMVVWRRRRLTEVTRTFFDTELRRRRLAWRAALRGRLRRTR